MLHSSKKIVLFTCDYFSGTCWTNFVYSFRHGVFLFYNDVTGRENNTRGLIRSPSQVSPNLQGMLTYSTSGFFFFKYTLNCLVDQRWNFVLKSYKNGSEWAMHCCLGGWKCFYITCLTKLCGIRSFHIHHFGRSEVLTLVLMI